MCSWSHEYPQKLVLKIIQTMKQTVKANVLRISTESGWPFLVMSRIFQELSEAVFSARLFVHR